MSIAPDSTRLLALEIRTEHDVVLCRQRARQMAAGLGFDSQEQVRIATAVSEIARNAYQYARGGKVAFAVGTTLPSSKSVGRSLQMFTVSIKDQGPGIADLAGVLAGRVTSQTGLGVGIIGSTRLMDLAEFASSPQGTSVILGKYLPPSAKPLSPQQLQRVVDNLTAQEPGSVVEEIQNQNQELLRLMDELQKRKDEIENANRELEETNAGVLALYDELETLHRVGMMLAAKVELHELIQALIDATTDLTSAEWGAFYFQAEINKPYKLQATSGKNEIVLDRLPPVLRDGAEADFGPGRTITITNFGEAEPASLPGWLIDLRAATQFQSCLAVAVINAEGSMIGCIILGSAKTDAFSERGERIVTSIAVQVVVAVDKARLFDKVRESSSAKDRFLAMLSHELRTPLTPVMAVISSMHENAMLPEVFREDIGMALRNIKLETRIIDDLLDFHRLINGKFSLVNSAVDVHAMVQHVLQICREDVEEKGHEIVLELQAPRAVISGEAARIQQVLWNVMKNAIKFTAPRGSITIRSEEADSSLVVRIIDTGRGMTEEVIAVVFAPFEQGDSSIPMQFGGLGLGLAISKAFVEKHGGTIVAHSEGTGKGSTLTITLPLLNLESSASHLSSSSEATPHKEGKEVGLKILLVDDHQDTLSVLSRILRSKGHTVEIAASCAEALQSLKEDTELIISDVGLPDGTGYELMAKIRGQTQAPAIAMSGFGMESDVEESKAAGFQAHLTKPVEISKLLETIQQLANT
jgi:signal transduction histidine kinase